ncbi:hypothetical protein [Nodosilinea sp. LEGE 07298]|uniref:hypothetical protein n=1 Tax=Nodosilinea sp. LEGE 07298 TaxID=2777970 RepID=UPI001D14A1AA|nr:hypothetical protein [Nodosilinea sp. LEGE 07298]
MTSAAQRRQYIRAMFACIEGAVWLFKQEALEQHKNDASIVFTTSELSVLAEVAPSIDGRGVIQEPPANLRFVPNLLFAFGCHARAFDYEPVLRVSDHEWGDLKSSVIVRNRLMHPKQLSSMNISDDEIRTARAALKWFGLNCSAATLGVSMWYAKRAIQKIEDPEEAAAKLQIISTAAENLKRLVLDS